MLNRSSIVRPSFSLILSLILIGIGLVFYLSWLPDPKLSQYGFLPGWLARWTDADVNENLRTAVPLLFLGFFTGYWLSSTRRGWSWWMGALSGLVGVVFIAEAGQLILPRRNFDWGDVAWGTVGSLIGLIMAALAVFGIQLGAKWMSRWFVLPGLTVAMMGSTAFLQPPLYAQGVRLGKELNTSTDLPQLPPAKEKVVAAVYKFRDLSDQGAQTKTGNLRTATPNYTDILLKTLGTSGWFVPREYEKVGTLMNESVTMQSVPEQGANGGTPVPVATIFLESGLVSYETSTVVGEAEHPYFGKGNAASYQQDQVTVYVRVLATQSGRILKTVYASKTILSQLVTGNTYRYVSFLRPLEAETGLTTTKPGQLAVMAAIDKAVQGLIIEGVRDGLWPENNALAGAMKNVIDAYNREKMSLNEPDIQEKRSRLRPQIDAPFISLHPYAGMMRYSGDYTQQSAKGAYGISAELYLIPRIGVQINAATGTMASLDAFSVKLTSLEANAVFRPLPYQRWSPILYGGVGVVSRSSSTFFQLYGTKYGQAQGGIGIQFSPNSTIGFRSTLSYNQPFTDSLDGKIRGIHKDYHTRFTLGVLIHIGRFKMKTTPVKFTQVSPKG